MLGQGKVNYWWLMGNQRASDTGKQKVCSVNSVGWHRLDTLRMKTVAVRMRMALESRGHG